MKKYTVKKGKHDFRPLDGSLLPTLKWTKKSFSWDVKFDPSCRYELDNGDQGDINKGGGLTHYFSLNNKKSIMWGWAYSPERDLIDIFLYLNDKNKDKKFYLIDSVKFNQEVTITIDCEWDSKNGVNEFIGINFSLKSDDIDTKVIINLDDDNNSFISPLLSTKLMRRIGLYFGGNRKAPKDMIIYANFNS